MLNSTKKQPLQNTENVIKSREIDRLSRQETVKIVLAFLFKRGLLLKERISSHWEKILSFRVDSFQKGLGLPEFKQEEIKAPFTKQQKIYQVYTVTLNESPFVTCQTSPC